MKPCKISNIYVSVQLSILLLLYYLSNVYILFVMKVLRCNISEIVVSTTETMNHETSNTAYHFSLIMFSLFVNSSIRANIGRSMRRKKLWLLFLATEKSNIIFCRTNIRQNAGFNNKRIQILNRLQNIKIPLLQFTSDLSVVFLVLLRMGCSHT